MIAAWMAYCIAIGVALGVAGRAIERALDLSGRPTRWAWSAALLGTLLLPLAALLRPQAFRTITVPITAPARAPVGGARPGATSDPGAGALPAWRGPTWTELDSLLRWGWGLASGALFFVLGGAAVRLAALRRGWRPALVDGHAVLVADDVGPAVAGLWTPRIVLPNWALALTERQRRLMLAHEEEHLRARDPWLLAGGAVALALTPWNPAAWWVLRRLRLAVEMDCDARVLGRGHSTRDYGELMLAVGQHRVHLPLTAAALGEPRSLLERRIRRMVARRPRWRWLGATAAATIAALAVVGACEAPRPTAPPSPSPATNVYDPGADSVRLLARRYHPEVFTHPLPGAAVALVFDTRQRVVGHAAGVREAQDRACMDVVDRLVPTFAAHPWRSGGCAEAADGERTVVVYWKALQQEVLTEPTGDEPAVFLAAPPEHYPALLRQAGIQGRVAVRAVIDAAGRAEPGSLQVIETPHPGFAQAARTLVLQMRFDHGPGPERAVRVVIEFRL